LGGPPTRPIVLLFAGDWTLSKLALQEHVERFSASLARLEAGAFAKARRVMAPYAFSRRLARIADPAQLYQLIVDGCARSVLAQKASLAVYDADQRALTIPATYGYPGVLVRHLRCYAGVGIIGRVFSSGRPLCVDDVRRLAGVRPRLRYQTNSFISVPLAGVGGPIGVVSVTDRRDGREFDRRDLSMIRGLAAVAGLALDRLLAMDEARTNALIAAVDPVTGLFNRRYFHTRLDEEIERARRQTSPLTVLLIDVDNFKQLNDRLGHPGGDAVLRVVADVLRRSVRLFDVCARYGGDEFAILMPGSSLESSAQIAERIREGIQECRPPGVPASEELTVTASIGIATTSGVGGEDVIARADQALYEAKRQGKNRAQRGPL
jgi:diguanylate cyclase (GGDEF)-like protein